MENVLKNHIKFVLFRHYKMGCYCIFLTELMAADLALLCSVNGDCVQNVPFEA